MKVKDLLSKKASTVYITTPDTTITEVIKELNQHNVGALLVMRDEKLVGIISERDILHAAGEHGAKIENFKVGDFMTKDLITCGEDESTDDVMGLMTVNHIRHLPILDDEKLIGIISIGDVVKAQLKKTKAEADDLKEYIHGRR